MPYSNHWNHTVHSHSHSFRRSHQDKHHSSNRHNIHHSSHNRLGTSRNSRQDSDRSRSHHSNPRKDHNPADTNHSTRPKQSRRSYRRSIRCKLRNPVDTTDNPPSYYNHSSSRHNSCRKDRNPADTSHKTHPCYNRSSSHRSTRGTRHSPRGRNSSPPNPRCSSRLRTRGCTARSPSGRFRMSPPSPADSTRFRRRVALEARRPRRCCRHTRHCKFRRSPHSRWAHTASRHILACKRIYPDNYTRCRWGRFRTSLRTNRARTPCSGIAAGTGSSQKCRMRNRPGNCHKNRHNRRHRTACRRTLACNSGRHSTATCTPLEWTTGSRGLTAAAHIRRARSTQGPAIADVQREKHPPNTGSRRLRPHQHNSNCIPSDSCSPKK